MDSLTRGVIGVSVIALLLALPVVAGPRHFVTIDIEGATQTFVLGINPSGDLVGAWDDPLREHGFVLRNGVVETFDFPGSTWTAAYGINARGDIVGQYGLSDNTTHGFIRLDGVMYPLEFPDQATNLGPANTMPVKINSEGTVVGCYHQSLPSGATILSTMHGFVMTADGAFSSYPDARTMHNGINPAGAITGNIFDSTNTSRESYVIADGVTTYFKAASDALVTRSWDINASGAVAGWFRDAAKKIHGFLLREGTVTQIDVNLPGVKQTQAFGISPSGDIVGYYQDGTGFHGFVLTRDTE